MPRPPKSRRVSFLPNLTYFKPAGVPLKKLEEECLSFEELEALRLKDLEGLEQEACAEKMAISRPTFHRIITGARQKLARALVEGKAIRIEGGHYQLAPGWFNCRCGFAGRFVEEHPRAQEKKGLAHKCPRCGVTASGSE